MGTRAGPCIVSTSTLSDCSLMVTLRFFALVPAGTRIFTVNSGLLPRRLVTVHPRGSACSGFEVRPSIGRRSLGDRSDRIKLHPFVASPPDPRQQGHGSMLTGRIGLILCCGGF